jgi:hypothetical protein
MHRYGAHKDNFWMFLRKKHYSELKFHRLHREYWFVFRNAAWHVLLLPLCSGGTDGQLFLVTDVRFAGYWDHNFLVFETSSFPLVRPVLRIYWDQIFSVMETSPLHSLRTALSSDTEKFSQVTPRLVLDSNWVCSFQLSESSHFESLTSTITGY